MKIYLACALTQVPRDEFADHVNLIHSIASGLSDLSTANQVKYALVDSDPDLARHPREDKARLCYLWDRRMVEESNLVVAEVSYPSIGLGIEIQLAEAKKIPVILIYRRTGANKMAPVKYENPDGRRHDLQIGEGFISLMALGSPAVSCVIEYADSSHAVMQLNKSIKTLGETLCVA
jgi:hypothetical protein